MAITSLINNKPSYQGNTNLKKVGHVIQYTNEQVKELIRCSSDPIYFIENYCRIVSLDKGLVLFKLYDCQKEKVKTILNERKVILMEPRQQGKCLYKNTKVRLRRKSTGEIFECTLGEFYAWQKFNQLAQDDQLYFLQSAISTNQETKGDMQSEMLSEKQIENNKDGGN